MVAFVGLGLMFALMVCVFYEKAITVWVTGCTKKAVRETKNVSNRMAEIGNKKKKRQAKDQQKSQGQQEEREKRETDGKRTPANGYNYSYQLYQPVPLIQKKKTFLHYT